ncbi:hypothetical protein AUR67_10665 [Pseudoalteromonas sp. XI10]|uniref:hypothetical protein n=1 Tax=Pseudoalteromonas sp. XI10 TaxID=1766621 RepID=UPI0007336966|nr:hypothetical protein [Pseudoalteromonas sp. XI10]KTG20624.1 hypothetical protein AUR67_10665 [Pseudoalteromonas sp. XI10]
MKSLREIELQFLAEKIGGHYSGKNWLGRKSGSGAAQIEALLLVGARREQLETCRGAVDEHIRFLEKKIGLKVEISADGIYQFKFCD